MTESEHSQTKNILKFWFGALDESGDCAPEVKKRWFQKDADFDREIREKFSAVYAELASQPGAPPSWVRGSEGLLGGIIVLDQFSRNMFRDTAAMYSADGLARALTFELLALGFDKKLPHAYRTFSYMPLMHSERLEDQQRCVELFESFAEELSGDRKKAISNNARYAIMHRDIVARFGRFPHRNAILGRPSTPEEVEFLKEPGSSF